MEIKKDIGEEIISKLEELDRNLDRILKEKNEKDGSATSSSGN